jgi:catechol 2,3-dioxygenase-like lactoylglutathione lyase family enzyme
MISGINHITFAVRDIDVSFAFYRDVLGLLPRARWRRGAYFCAGNVWLSLVLCADRDACEQDDHSHAAFTVGGEDYGVLSERILDSGAPLWKENNSEGLSLYFSDPDGHKLEIHVSGIDAAIARLREQRPDGLEIFETTQRLRRAL